MWNTSEHLSSNLLNPIMRNGTNTGSVPQTTCDAHAPAEITDTTGVASKSGSATSSTQCKQVAYALDPIQRRRARSLDDLSRYVPEVPYKQLRNEARLLQSTETAEHMLSPTDNSTFWQFSMRSILAYFSACLLTEGSMVFTLSYTSQWVQLSTPLIFPPTMTQWPNLIGCLWFVLSAYCGFAQQLNLELEERDLGEATRLRKYPMRWWAFPWQCSRSYGMIGWQSLFYGATFFFFGILYGCLLAESQVKIDLILLVWAPMAVGGVFFVVAGVMCTLENKNEPRWSWIRICCLVDLLSATAFFIGSAAPIADPIDAPLLLFGSAVPFFLGSLGYLFTGICSISMWKHEMFGLMLNHALNQPIREAQYESPSSFGSPNASASNSTSFLSSNTVIVNVIYIGAAAISTFNFCCALTLTPIIGRTNETVNNFFVLVIVHLLLLLTSLVPRLPKAQPARGLMLSVRLLSVLLVLDVVSNFLDIVQRTPRDTDATFDK